MRIFSALLLALTISCASPPEPPPPDPPVPVAPKWGHVHAPALEKLMQDGVFDPSKIRPDDCKWCLGYGGIRKPGFVPPP
jgi:hypothetical protein